VYWKKHSIPFERPKGPQRVLEEVESVIHQVHEENIKKGIRCIFETLIMKKYAVIYEIDFVNMIWHIDLHQLSDIGSKYLIEFIDDKSRKITACCFLKDK
jgi:hypothetical protein